MTNITEGHPNFKTFERTVFDIMCTIACQLMSYYLEMRDKSIMAMRDTKEYRFIDRREATIKTLMGEVRYNRGYYRRTSGGYIFLLDVAMGIDNNYGLVSENLAEQIIVESTEKSFRKTAAGISNNTGQIISAMGAWNVVQKYGKNIEQQELRLQELDRNESTGHLGNISTPVLFSEYDDVWLSRQPEKRHKKSDKEEKPKKIGKKPMHVGIAYTGWEQSKDGRYSTTDKIAYASYGKASVFVSVFESLLRQQFDMDVVDQRLINGDGESWIRTAAEETDSILQLDPYHKGQAVVKAVKDKSDRQLINAAISENDVEKTLAIIGALASTTTEVKTQEKLEKLYEYFDNNKDIFLTWQERGVELPAPPEGISYRNMGVMEPNNCSLITQRMKHRKGSWTEKGADRMAKILCIKNTIGFNVMLGTLPEPDSTRSWIEPLSAAQTPKHDGKGYGADWLQAPMPFEQAFKTNGRDAIRGMLGMRPLSELPIAF